MTDELEKLRAENSPLASALEKLRQDLIANDRPRDSVVLISTAFKGIAQYESLVEQGVALWNEALPLDPPPPEGDL